MALPHSIGTLTIYPRKVNGEPIFAEVTPSMENGKVSFDARVVDAKGTSLSGIVQLPDCSAPILGRTWIDRTDESVT